MALTLNDDGGTLLSDGTSTTGWARTGFTAGPLVYTNYSVSGITNDCLAFRSTASSGFCYYTISPALNFTTTYAGKAFYIWVMMLMPQLLNLMANGGGAALIAGSSTSAYKKFSIAGGDQYSAFQDGFKRFTFDPTLTPSETIGSPDMAAISIVGFFAGVTATSSYYNVFIGPTGIEGNVSISGTSSAFWDDALAVSAGRIRKKDNAYIISKGLTIGGSSNTSVSDARKDIILNGLSYYLSGSWTPLTNATITIKDTASYTTYFKDGNPLGTETGKGGSTLLGTYSTVAFTAGNLVNSGSKIELHSTNFRNFSGGLSFPSTPNSYVYSSAIQRCGAILPGSTKFRDITVSGPLSGTTAAIHWDSSTNLANSTIRGAINYPAIRFLTYANPFTLSGVKFLDNTTDLQNLNAQTVTVNLTNGSSATTTSGNFIVNSLSSITIYGSVSLLGAEIRIYALDGNPAGSYGTELAGVENNPSSSYVYNGTPNDEVWLQIMLSGYEEYGQKITMSSSSSVFTAQLIVDNNQ